MVTKEWTDNKAFQFRNEIDWEEIILYREKTFLGKQIIVCAK